MLRQGCQVQAIQRGCSRRLERQGGVREAGARPPHVRLLHGPPHLAVHPPRRPTPPHHTACRGAIESELDVAPGRGERGVRVEPEHRLVADRDGGEALRSGKKRRHAADAGGAAQLRRRRGRGVEGADAAHGRRRGAPGPRRQPRHLGPPVPGVDRRGGALRRADVPGPAGAHGDVSAGGEEEEEETAYDVVAVKLPCGRAATWSKDVARLHLQLAAARLAARARHGGDAAHVLVVSRCFPLPNLFRCRDEVARDGDVWLYRPDVSDLRRKLDLPVGSCKLAMPFNALGKPYVSDSPPRREAYATILHSEQLYACGAIALARSIRSVSGSQKRDMVALVDETISAVHRGALEEAGWKTRTVQRIRNPKASKHAYNEWNYSKFWLWTLTSYDRVIFLDADLLVQRSMDPLFAMPEVSATGNHGAYFNSGVMVVEPCNCTFRLLTGHVADIESYNGGDQGYLNEVFAWWHRLPSHANYMKHFWDGDTAERARAKRQVLAADPPVGPLAVHFVGLKPWFCFRDYDCNWNVRELRQFASDEAHARWWKVHDAMPGRLREFCLLDERQKALLRWDVARAREANLSDAHWSVRIADPRRTICGGGGGGGGGEACREREIAGRRVEGNRITTSYAKLIDNF